MTVIESLPDSQAAICNAFVELLREMPCSAVRVKDIAERSGLGRTTFYLHYRDKADLLDKLEDLLISGYMELVRKVRRQSAEKFRETVTKGVHPVFVEYFSYLRENKEAFTALVMQQEGMKLVSKWCAELQKLDTDRYIRAGYPYNLQALQRYHNLLVVSYVSIIVDWIRGGMDFSDEAMGVVMTSYWNSYILHASPAVSDLLTDPNFRMNQEEQESLV